ncbi:MAG TPA: LysR family transcriptional regulator [Burkholderiaceae bacterium]|nr:LysR family transcriptional regulator [Burkholderiaceae bacterium]HQR72354.1 LysR family transcriptional regulator [Burkholderiaceae bacterium]
MKGVTLRQLRVFVAAARHLSFGKAAEELHLTPPAISMQIKELEDQVGLPLFDRSGRSVALTVTGEYLLVYARKILATLKDAEDAVARFRGLQTGRLTIGMVSTAKYFVPRLMARFRAEHPGVEVRLAIGGNREQLAGLLRANEVDLAIMGRPPREMATRAEPFAVHPHVIVTPPDHPLTRIGHAPAAALGDYEFLIREEGSGTRAAMEKFFADHRLQPRIAMEMPSNETIKQAVMAGIGISFLSLHTIGIELKAGLIAVPDIEDLPVLRRWYVVNTLAKTLSPAAEAFRYFILEEAERYLAQEYGAPAAAEPA